MLLPFSFGALPSGVGGGLLPLLRQPPFRLGLLTILAASIVGLLLRVRALLRRTEWVSFQLLPSPVFSPTGEDLRRFAGALGWGASGWRRFPHIEEPAVIRLRRMAPADTTFSVEVPKHQARRIRAACYPGVELIEMESTPGDGASNPSRWRELVLRRSSLHPLRRIPLSPDPKSGLCSVLDLLKPREEAEVALVLWRSDGAWRRYLARERGRASAPEFLRDVWGEMNGRSAPKRQPQPVHDKVEPGTPVFRARVFARVAGPRKARALLAEVCWGLEAFDGENSLRPVRGIAEVLLARTSSRRLLEGAIAPRRHQFLSLHEIAALCHPPARDCAGLHVARSEAVPAPVDALPEFENASAEPEHLLPEFADLLDGFEDGE